MTRYRKYAARMAKRKLAGLKEAAPDLLQLVSDERMLRAAWDHLAKHGSHTPGPDGDTYGDLSDREMFDCLRGYRDAIRAGQYELSDERVQTIPKAPGKGFRNLTIMSIFDRVVHRAVVEGLQPLFEGIFDPCSYGYRPKRGPRRALAAAAAKYRSSDRRVWVSADIRDAFPSVPIPRLLTVLGKYLPDKPLNAFLEAAIRPGKLPGLRQGSPLSPLLLNLYLHHALDRPWRTRHAGVPLFRFADDILALCRSPQEGAEVHATLVELLRPAGLALKENAAAAVHDLSNHASLDWMGFGIALDGDALRYSVTERAWESLREHLADAQAKPNSPITALASIRGWVVGNGPCLKTTDLSDAYERIKALAGDAGFDEIFPERHVWKMWEAGHLTWRKALKKAIEADVTKE